MTAADPRRDRLNRIASARPQCAGHKPQRSEAASTNELHTAIAAAEDVVDPRSVSAACHPLDAWDVQFGPVDALNPGCGYSLRVERNGQLVTHTGKQGDTGKDLAGPADCMRELSQILPGGFTPDPVPQGVMESIAAMGAEQDRRNAASTSVSHCDICGRTSARYRRPNNGHRRGQYLCEACFTKHAAPCSSSVLIDDLPPAYIAISDEGDECIIKRFDSEEAANRYARETSDSTGGNVGMVVMPSRVAFAALDLLAACELAWSALGLGRTLPIGVPVELHDALREAITKATGGAK